MMENLVFLPIEQLSRKLDDGEISSVALTQAYLDRIERFNGTLHAYVNVYAQDALAQAACSDQRRAARLTLGPLDGIPIAIKDLCAMTGRPLTGGSKPWEGRLAQTTATAVQRLLGAGAVILGSTHMVEFAFGAWGTNAHMGTPRNPWDLARHRVPGGSSSGSGVSVAAGLAAAAIGSDTGGSIRTPSMLNGITGLKTTTGLISLAGCIDLSHTLDTLGPMTRSVWDAALLTRIMAGYDAADVRTHTVPRVNIGLPGKASLSAAADAAPLAGVTLGVIPMSAYPAPLSAATAQALQAATQTFESLGATLVERDLPFDFLAMMADTGKIIAAEGHAIYRDTIQDMSLALGPAVRERLKGGAALSSADYIAIQTRHRAARAQWAAWMTHVDALIVPGLPAACALTEADENQTPLSPYTRPANFLGACALALPGGFDGTASSGAGLPVGFQLYGKPLDEDTLVRVGYAFQVATDWHLRHPSL